MTKISSIMTKKIYLLLCAVLLSSVVCAQMKSLTIDCQTPGWLSSKINYGDQLTVENLKVTGYVNSTDLKFIGTLMGHSLKGKLDLSDITIVKDDNGENNTLKENVFDIKSDTHIRCLELPKSIIKIEKAWGTNWQYKLEIDSLYIGGKNTPSIHVEKLKLGINSPAVIILREGVETITSQNQTGTPANLQTELKETVSIILPSTMKSLPKAFLANATKMQSMNLPNSIEEIGEYAFVGTTFLPKELYMPKSLKRFSFNILCNALPNVLYLPENVTAITNKEKYDNNSGNSWYPQLAGTCPVVTSEKMEIHIKSKEVPSLSVATTSDGSSVFQNCTIYVPHDLIDSYKERQYYKNATILPEKEITSLSINAKDGYYVGDDFQLSAAYTPLDATDKFIEWNTLNSDIVALSKDGKAICKQYGKATITASTSYDKLSTNMDMWVYEHTTGVKLDTTKVSMLVGDHYVVKAEVFPLEFSDGKVSWRTTDEKVAVVDNQGRILAKGAGSCEVICTTTDRGYVATCKVEVKISVGSVDVMVDSVEMRIGEVGQLKATVLPSDASDKRLQWISSNDSVVKVNDNGVIEALKSGSAYIKAISLDNPTATDSCLVVVAQPVKGITLDHTTYTFKAIGESLQLTATLSPENATNKEVKWKSSNESVCIVSNGTVVALGYGTAVIIATTVDGGHMATCVITVEQASAIDTNVMKASLYRVYNMQGIEIPTLKKGINIVRFNDGKMIKVFVK